MVELYIKTVEKHLRKICTSHQRDWDEKLPLFLLACRASTHDTTSLTPASLLLGRELGLPCDLLFGVSPDQEQPTTYNAADLVEHLHDIHDYARRHLILASDRVKTRYDKLANSAGYHEGDRVCFYLPTLTKGKSPELQSAWGGPYKRITRIYDVVYRIHKTPRSRMMVVHLERLPPYQEVARDERPQGASGCSRERTNNGK
jgi:hypothetical protein